MTMEDGYVNFDDIVSQYEYTEAPVEVYDDEKIYQPYPENEND